MQQMAERALDTPSSTLEIALGRIALRAAELDASPRFPSESFESLIAAGIPQLAADRERCTFASELALVRAVAGVDASTARILDGHLNGVERLALSAPGELRERDLDAVASGELLLGVWGADPAPGEGEPARIEQGADGGLVLDGVKTFCSGAGGVQRALIVARDEDGARRVAYVDTACGGVRIDRGWYRASGLRASESHRVVFEAVPVLAVLGGENELTREPWFSRDAVRTSATWAGLADAILAATVDGLRGASLDDMRLHTVGAMRVAHATVDRWLAHAAARLEHTAAQLEHTATSLEHPAGEPDPALLAGECRVAIAAAARELSALAAQACGSRVLASGGALDRARRDLDLFLLQHRLDAKVIALGRATLEKTSR
jgi:alkylation response protein AidB-like acyl-CoA dehydrogenase